MSTFQLDGGPPPSSQKLGVGSDGWMTFITTGADEVRRRRRWASDDDAAYDLRLMRLKESRSLPSNSGLPFAFNLPKVQLPMVMGTGPSTSGHRKSLKHPPGHYSRLVHEFRPAFLQSPSTTFPSLPLQ